jgi:diguanylate cyclase (GGDEF)-like protein
LVLLREDTQPIPIHATARLAVVRSQPCLTVLAGDGVGRVFRLDQPRTVLGRATESDICLPSDGVSRRHAAIVKDGDELDIIDLDSTNGVWVEGTRVRRHRLREGERIQLGARAIVQFSRQSEDQEEVQRRLYESATRDPLTLAANRRVFDEHLAREASHARRHDGAFSLLVFDIDHFKRINDEHGHAAGDEVLRRLGERVAASIRVEDVFCRTGGEEFALVTRDPSLAGAQQFGERLRRLVEADPFIASGRALAVTISVGVATWSNDHPTPAALLEIADAALYEAKRSGRNRVVG